MAKRYIDELAAWAEKREAARRKPRQDKNLVAFLAVRDDVKAAIDAGYALKTIWEHMQETGKITFRYETFLKHVNRQIKAAKQKEQSSDAVVQDTAPAEPKPQAPKETKSARKTEIGAFKFEAKPNKEDLI